MIEAEFGTIARRGFTAAVGADPIDASILTLAFDDDESRDVERKHTHEQVAYFVLGN